MSIIFIILDWDDFSNYEIYLCTHNQKSLITIVCYKGFGYAVIFEEKSDLHCQSCILLNKLEQKDSYPLKYL